MNENNKRIIYNAESFTNIIAEINNHIANINNCFNDDFTLESYNHIAVNGGDRNV